MQLKARPLPSVIFLAIAVPLCWFGDTTSAQFQSGKLVHEENSPRVSDTSTSQEEVNGEVRGLIQQLGDRDFRTREQAGKRLAEIGVAALPELRKASKVSEDAEASRRLQALVEEIERKDGLARAVRVKDVAFGVVTDSVWSVPKPGEHTKIKLGLEFTNLSKDKLYFYLTSLQTVHLDLLNSKGERMRRTGGRNGLSSAEITMSPVLNKEQSYTLLFSDAKLCWTGKEGGELCLICVDGKLPWREYLYYPKLSRGRYYVTFRYANESNLSLVDIDGSARRWVGDASTHPVAIEIK